MDTPQSIAGESGNGRVNDLLRRITDDLKVIAKDEVELVKGEFNHTAKTAAFEASIIILGGVVALIGLGMLCLAAVAALTPVIHSLALRLLLMAAVYIVVGGAVAASFAKRLSKDIRPDTTVLRYEAQRTLKGAKATLSEEGFHA